MYMTKPINSSDNDINEIQQLHSSIEVEKNNTR